MRELQLPDDLQELNPTRRPSAFSPSGTGADVDLVAILDQVVSLLNSFGEDFAGQAGRIRDMMTRLAEGRFHLAVLGQFKRGKSTLLNALLGQAILPTAVVPLTAIPTFVRAGTSPRSQVYFMDHRRPQTVPAATAEELANLLATFVTESGNPENKLGVAHVEVFYPAAILNGGVVLIDTPGIGSTFRHNTEATLNFLPQCDAALFLVSADPPITEVEIEFLRQVRTKVPRLFFILNKVDYLGPEDRQAAVAFLRKVLTEQAKIDPAVPIFCVSARQGLESRRTDNPALWADSGLATVEQYLVGFLAREKMHALREAIGHKATDVMADVLMRLRLAIRSLQLPLEDLQERLATFERKIEDIQQQRVVASDLLAGDCRRMHAFLEEQADRLRTAAQQYLEQVVAQSIARMEDEAVTEDTVQGALAEAIPGYFEHQTGSSTRLFRDRMAEVLRPHQERAEQLIEVIRHTAADLFDVPYHAPESGRAFEMVQQPYWVTHTWSSRLSPIPEGLVDGLLPVGRRRRRIQKRLLDEVASLVVSNVETAQREFAAESGFCPVHTWQLAAVSSPQGLSLGYPKLVERLVSRLASLVAVPETGIKALQVLVPGPLECRVCRLLQHAEQTYVPQLVTFLQTGLGRQAYTKSQGLCLRHLGMLTAAAPRGLGEFLVTHTMRRFEEMAEDMRSYALKRDAIRPELSNRNEAEAHVRAIIHIVGESRVCMPWRQDGEM